MRWVLLKGIQIHIIWRKWNSLPLILVKLSRYLNIIIFRNVNTRARWLVCTPHIARHLTPFIFMHDKTFSLHIISSRFPVTAYAHSRAIQTILYKCVRENRRESSCADIINWKQSYFMRFKRLNWQPGQKGVFISHLIDESPWIMRGKCVGGVYCRGVYKCKCHNISARHAFKIVRPLIWRGGDSSYYPADKTSLHSLSCILALPYTHLAPSRCCGARASTRPTRSLIFYNILCLFERHNGKCNPNGY